MQPLSIDEAALDLSGTEALHGAPPAVMLARLARRVEREVGVTVSIGLAANRLLAKLAAGRDKPRGFAVLGGEAAAVLAPEPVRLLPGVGPALERRLAALGLTRLGQLQALDDRDGAAAAGRRRAGAGAPRARRGCARVDPRAWRKVDQRGDHVRYRSDGAADLERQLWRLAEKLAGRLRAEDLAAAAWC